MDKTNCPRCFCVLKLLNRIVLERVLSDCADSVHKLHSARETQDQLLHALRATRTEYEQYQLRQYFEGHEVHFPQLQALNYIEDVPEMECAILILKCQEGDRLSYKTFERLVRNEMVCESLLIFHFGEAMLFIFLSKVGTEDLEQQIAQTIEKLMLRWNEYTLTFSEGRGCIIAGLDNVRCSFDTALFQCPVQKANWHDTGAVYGSLLPLTKRIQQPDACYEFVFLSIDKRCTFCFCK